MLKQLGRLAAKGVKLKPKVETFKIERCWSRIQAPVRSSEQKDFLLVTPPETMCIDSITIDRTASKLKINVELRADGIAHSMKDVLRRSMQIPSLRAYMIGLLHSARVQDGMRSSVVDTDFHFEVDNEGVIDPASVDLIGWVELRDGSKTLSETIAFELIDYIQPEARP